MSPLLPASPLFPYTTLVRSQARRIAEHRMAGGCERVAVPDADEPQQRGHVALQRIGAELQVGRMGAGQQLLEARHADRSESTRLHSSHLVISYAAFSLKKQS